MQNITEITVHEIDLSRFGKTPSGAPLFRVVWGPSRVEKLWYRETQQLIEAKMYPQSEEWVLEKWMSGLDWAGTPENFATQQSKMTINMEYPADGEYGECMRFPNNDAVSMAPMCVEMLLYGTTNVTEAERIAAIKLREEMKEKDADERASAMIRDALGATNWSGKRVKLYDAAGNTIQ
jgi:hypothetical protein